LVGDVAAVFSASDAGEVAEVDAVFEVGFLVASALFEVELFLVVDPGVPVGAGVDGLVALGLGA
jgi:hypothetical protein